jgi:hypothetical protein
VVREAPCFVRAFIRHRKAREAAILRRLGKGEADIPAIVRALYIGLDPRLTKRRDFPSSPISRTSRRAAW